MPGELRVDTAPLATGGQGLLSAAGDIPLPPVPFTAAGGDALSTILNARTQAIEAPFIAGMPVTKAEALRTAQNIIQAAGIYERVDQQIADQILKALFGIEGMRARALAASAVLAVARGCGGHGWRTGDRCDVGRDSGGGGRAAGGSDGPVDGHADADGIAGCPDTNAIGGHGGVDSAGNHAGRAERDAAGRPNGRRRRGKADPELDQPGEGSPDEAKHAESAEEIPAEKAQQSAPSDGAAGPSNAERAPATGPQPTPRRMFRSSRTSRPRRARRRPDRKAFCDMSFRDAKVCR